MPIRHSRKLLCIIVLVCLAIPAHSQAGSAAAPAPTPTAKALRGQAIVLLNHSHPAAAIPLLEQAYQQAKATHDSDGQGTDLKDTGWAYNDLSQPAKAIPYYQQALPLFVKAGDSDGQARDLQDTGIAYNDLSQPAKAITFYQQALPLFVRAGDSKMQAAILLNTGVAYDDLSQPAKAIDFYRKALPFWVTAHDSDSQGKDLMDIGGAYDDLSQPAKAIRFYQQALPLYVKAGDTDGQGVDLLDTGNAYADLSQSAIAIRFYQQALPLLIRAGRSDAQATDLLDIGRAYTDLSQPAKAIRFYQQALPLYVKAGDTDQEADDLRNLGIAYVHLTQYTKAIGLYQEALPLLVRAGNRSTEAKDLNDMMLAWTVLAKPRMAIFYGKQSVNVYQSIRADLQTMDQQVQQTYLVSVSKTYRTLADLLIAQGRLPEAEQVLDLLKRQELSEVLRGPVAVPGIPGTVDFNAQEATEETQYEAIADQITDIGQKQQALLDQEKHSGGALPAADQKQLDSYTAQLALANHHLRLFLTQLTKAFSAPTAANQSLQTRLLSVKDAAGLQDTLRQLHDQGQDVVVLETLVAPDRFAVIVTTAQSRKVEQYAITSDEFNKKIAALQDALRDPHVDPIGPSHALYEIVFAPLEADLKQAHATTLMWSLDGTLRYIPIAALYDGKQYLVQRFDNEVFTLGSQSGFGDDGTAQWRALGLGVTQAQTVTDPATGKTLDFPALSDVAPELYGVVQNAHHPGGALPGTVLLDGQFTATSAAHALETQKYNVVHIASHFALQPTAPDDSFLLAGNGSWSLSAMADNSTLFSGVDLLALSACDTASGTADGDGKEVDSLGSVAQEDGAQSVLASLWPVADTSTQMLMDAFYRWHETHPKDSKAEALRQAQLSLLTGTAPIPPGATRGITADDSPEAPGAPAFKTDPKAPYAHPFYWAPFVLIGNWR